MPDIVPIQRALISVSDKSGLVAFAQALAASGVEILSTGGSAQVLRDANVPVKEVAEHTGFPEILDGRVKTLVPQIHGGILGRRDNAEHLAQMAAHDIAPIDLVAVNLYPFEATVAKGAPDAECVENIDIGGPALIRAAAKNHDFVAILTEPEQYDTVLGELAAHGGTTLGVTPPLAGDAYARTAAYDAAIATWFAEQRLAVPSAPRLVRGFPRRLTVAGTLRQTLRYGENPHQQAAFYVNGTRPGVATARQLQGKELSYNNLADTDAAFECVAEFDDPTVAIIKHANPCGVASAATLAEAWDLAFRCDPISPFGGIVAVNRTLDVAAAEKIAAILTEVIVAPDATEAAIAAVARRRNLRLLLTGGMPDPLRPGWTFRSLSGGFLAQTRDTGRVRCRRSQGRNETRADRGRTGGSVVRVHRVQAREIQRHRLCQGRRHGGHWLGPAEPGRLGAHCRLEIGIRRRDGGPAGTADRGQRRCLGRVLSVCGWVGSGGRGGRHGGDPARWIDPRRGSDRGSGRCGSGDGVYRNATFSALK